MRLLIDMDGVAADLLTPWLDWINKRFPPFATTDSADAYVMKCGMHPDRVGRFKPKDITQWDIGEATGLGPEVFEFFNEPNVFRHLKPLPYAVEVLEALHKDGHEIHYVTACTRGHEDKLEWVKEHTPFIPLTRVNFVQEKHIVEGDVLFDDKPETVEKAASNYYLGNGWDAKPVCMDTAYNRSLTVDSFMRYWRVSNWHQFYGLIKAWEKPLIIRKWEDIPK